MLQVDIEIDLEGMADNGADLIVEVELDFDSGASKRDAGLPYDLDGQGPNHSVLFIYFILYCEAYYQLKGCPVDLNRQDLNDRVRIPTL